MGGWAFVQTYSISAVTAGHSAPYSVNELWANPMPPASPPVLCSHKALHYHRAWRDREALKSGVQWREGVVVAKRRGVGGCRFIVAHHSKAMGLLLRDPGFIRSAPSPFSGSAGTNT